MVQVPLKDLNTTNNMTVKAVNKRMQVDPHMAPHRSKMLMYWGEEQQLKEAMISRKLHSKCSINENIENMNIYQNFVHRIK